MKKTELIDAIAAEAGLSAKDAGSFLNGFVSVLTEQMRDKEKVTITGFGTFEGVERKARNGVNPRTGEKIKIKKSVAVRFKAGATLKKKVNEPKKRGRKKKAE